MPNLKMDVIVLEKEQENGNPNGSRCVGSPGVAMVTSAWWILHLIQKDSSYFPRMMEAGHHWSGLPSTSM